MLVAVLSKEPLLACDLRNALDFFATPDAAGKSGKILLEYQKVTLSALTICCTCD